MPAAKKNIRITASAAIVRDDKILLIEFLDESGPHYNFPGGGVEVGESVIEAVKRECLEEASAEIEVERLLLMWEYIPEKQNYIFGPRQKLGLVFLCQLKEGCEPKMPSEPDKNQVGVVWLPLNELPKSKRKHPLLPEIADELIEAINNPTQAPRIIVGV